LVAPPKTFKDMRQHLGVETRPVVDYINHCGLPLEPGSENHLAGSGRCVAHDVVEHLPNESIIGSDNYGITGVSFDNGSIDSNAGSYFLHQEVETKRSLAGLRLPGLQPSELEQRANAGAGALGGVEDFLQRLPVLTVASFSTKRMSR